MWKAAVVSALLAQYVDAQAMLRFGCTQLVVERTDPIVNPGAVYTGHLHQIIGGNSFNITMDPESHDLGKLSTCTSCSFAEDFSNYWTATIMAKSDKGTYHRVPTTGNGGPQGKLDHGPNGGGMDIYYMHPPRAKVTAFKPGFRMIAGDAGNTDAASTHPGICNRCWTSPNENQFVGGAPCSGADTVELPQSPTCQMIRQTIIFPDCWDGKNLDSANHQDHVAYSGGGRYVAATGGSNCPATHPIKLPQIMYELMWDVKKLRETVNIQELVMSMGLGGSAIHGDYVFGWKDNTLQDAMDMNCNLDRDCPNAGLSKQSTNQMLACTVPQSAPENTGDGPEGLAELNTLGMETR